MTIRWGLRGSSPLSAGRVLGPRRPTAMPGGASGGPSLSRGDQMPKDQQLWGGETAKAVENFPISGETVPESVIHWLAAIKGAAAAVNGELGLLSKRSASRIEKAAAEIAAGRHDDQFPIDVFQTGSGTSTNMNANE